MDLSWMYSGVDHTLEGNGGPKCATYLNVWRRLVETLVICALAVFYLKWGYKRIHAPIQMRKDVEQRDRFGKRLLLVSLCLTFGCEIGFKLATRTVIYLLNPCHVVTIMQIYLLASPPSRAVTIVFRWHLHCINGAILALAFPVLNTRLLPMEKEVYFIQHGMILIIPFYLLRVGGAYTLERLGDFSWAIMSLGALLLYHFLLLQLLGTLTEVNLNNMLCPAVSDPFRGDNYRIWATGHQSFLISCVGKMYLIVSKFILQLCGHEQSLHHPEDFEHYASLKSDGGQSKANTSTCSYVSDLKETFAKDSHGDFSKDETQLNNFMGSHYGNADGRFSDEDRQFSKDGSALDNKAPFSQYSTKIVASQVVQTNTNRKESNGKADHLD